MYYLIKLLLVPISILPFRVLYIISDVMYFIIYRLFKYRIAVVKENLLKSFPNKSIEELYVIEKKFYSNLCDSIVETIKLITISMPQLNKRITANWQVITQEHATGRVAQGHLSHLFNWEWGTVACNVNTPYQFVGIYNKVTNKAFNQLMQYIRGRSGTLLIDMNDMQAQMGEIQKGNTLWGFIADQNPSEPRRSAWITFLGRPTAFYKGAELVARRYNNIVFFGKIQRVKRGYYNIVLHKAFDQGKLTTDGEITTAYVRFLEQSIHEQPDNWVWSHRRWKHQPPINL
jgi:Kdo2-lipid IVA lauroyltransferase/acyltransferase